MLKLCPIVLATAFLTLPLAARPAVQGGTHPPFMIGLLESNGVLTPLARFERAAWTTPWPSVPIELSSLTEIREEWWPGSSRSPWRVAVPGGTRALRIQGPGKGSVDCGAVGAALMTDYRDGGGSRDVRRVGIAAAGVVDVRAIESFEVMSPQWTDVERRFHSELLQIKRSSVGVSLTKGARIPAPNGEVWLFEGRDAKYQIQLWTGASGGRRIHVVNEEAFGSDPLKVPIMIEPIGVIWGLEHLALLVAEQGWKGGSYAVLSITPGEVLALVTVEILAANTLQNWSGALAEVNARRDRELLVPKPPCEKHVERSSSQGEELAIALAGPFHLGNGLASWTTSSRFNVLDELWVAPATDRLKLSWSAQMGLLAVEGDAGNWLSHSEGFGAPTVAPHESPFRRVSTVALTAQYHGDQWDAPEWTGVNHYEEVASTAIIVAVILARTRVRVASKTEPSHTVSVRPA